MQTDLWAVPWGRPAHSCAAAEAGKVAAGGEELNLIHLKTFNPVLFH